MGRDVDQAFETFLGWLTPSSSESQAAASHRASMDSCLRASFGTVRLFRSGSFGHHTSVSGWSDIDYFAVLPRSQLTQNSTATLAKVRSALSARFPRTEVMIRNPAVVVPFGNTASERHEVIPADKVSDMFGYEVFEISDRYGGWMNASPLAHNDYVSSHNKRLGLKLKPLIRLLKHWNYIRSAGLRSFYLEMRTTEYARGESVIIYKHDVLRALMHLRAKHLAAIQDPIGVSGYIYPCSEASKADALSRIDSAIGRAQKAIECEKKGNVAQAFQYWDLLFGGAFPAYY